MTYEEAERARIKEEISELQLTVSEKPHLYGLLHLSPGSIDQILKLLCEEIRKWENPFRFVLGVSRHQAGQHEGFEDFRKKAISLFCPEEVRRE